MQHIPVGCISWDDLSSSPCSMSIRPLFHSAFAISRRTISVRGTHGLAFIVYLTVWLTRLITLTLGNFFAPLFLLGNFLSAFPIFVSVRMKFLSAGPTMVAGFGIESEYEGPLINDSSPDRLWVLRVCLHRLVFSSFRRFAVQALPRPKSPSRPQRISVVAVLTRRQRVYVWSSPSESQISPKSVETANFGYLSEVSVAVGILQVGVASMRKSLF